MPLALLTFATGLAISAVAIYYSVLGLASIFSAAVVPIIIMGTILELSKLVTAWWLKSNWTRAPILLRSYMLAAVVVLMLITSMGIFGFLSKAHSDQNLVSGDVQSKIAIYDEKIKTEKENIEANRKALKQMDDALDQVLGRSTDEKGADKAVAIRRSQQKERTRLQNEISQSQKSIAELNDARAPIAAEVRKVEAEVGPIKYIAAFIYGDDPDANVLEKAVTWVIITIVFVFDPLAVLLLLASQMSFQWLQEKRDAEDREMYGWEDEWTGQDVDHGEAHLQEAADAFNEVFAEELKQPEEPKPHHPDTHPYLRAGFGKGFENIKPMVHKPEPVVTEPNVELSEDDSAAEEALKWAKEQQAAHLQDEVKRFGYTSENGIVRVNNKNYIEDDFKEMMAMSTSYVQNEEQEQSGVWSKINSKISEEEYLKQASKRKDDNSNNAS